MIVRSLAVPLIIAYTAAPCSPGPMPFSQSTRNPSSPSAPEGTLPAATPPASAVDAGAFAGYVCPMHPEVTSSALGRCPKCGMSLVPK